MQMQLSHDSQRGVQSVEALMCSSGVNAVVNVSLFIVFY